MNTQNRHGLVWQAGASKVSITPQEPIRLSGFECRYGPSGEVRQDIYARALALRDETGEVSVIISSDLLGFTRDMANEIAERVARECGLARERLVINATHNHSAPVTAGLLPLYFELGDDEVDVIARYTAWVTGRLVESAALAVRELQPVQLAFSQSLAGFGVNRRRSRPGCRHLPGPVDHDVPVLTATTARGDLLAIVFGYACHTTASRGLQLHGDYAGFAELELEALYPGTTALFVTGCAGDINPLPRFRETSQETYGKILADAVEDVLETGGKPVFGPLRTAFEEVELPLQEPFGEAELRAQLPGTEHTRRRELEYALGFWERGEERETSRPFPIQVWSFGEDLLWIWLSGEPVVDYSLKFKEIYGWDSTWVSGYCNELLAYIPSQRVLEEGGYEGTEGVLEYGLPSIFEPAIEEVIAGGVEEMVIRLRHGAPASEMKANRQGELVG